jgi:uncharacterized phage-associated protein
LKHLGDGPITKKFTSVRRGENGKLIVYAPMITDKSDPTGETRKIIERVWKIYGKYSAIQLSNLAHENGTPWDGIYQQFSGEIPKHTDIPTEEITKYFRSKAKR